MARMIPDIEPSEVRYPGERLVFRWLRAELPRPYVVFHSVQLLQALKGPEDRHLEREADFVILHPEWGILVLEVKGGHGIELANGLWARRGETMEPQPTLQARRAMHLLTDWAVARGLVDLLPSSYAIVFPEVAWDGTPPQGLHPAQILDLRMSRDTTDAIERAFAVLAERRAPIPMPTLQRLEAGITGLINTFEPVGLRLDEAMHRFWILDEVQLAVHLQLHLGRPRMLVEGGAGTGKTELAFAAAIDHARRGQRVLLTCFNVALAEWLAERAEAVSAELDAIVGAKLVVQNVNSLAAEFAVRLRRLYSHDQKVVTGLLIDGSFPPEGEPTRFDAIIVDEGQDFDPEWLMALRELLADESSAFALFLDRRQRLFDVPRLADGLGLGVPLQLTLNYRNTKAIAGLCRHVEPSAPPSMAACPVGDPPVLHEVRERAQRATVQRVVEELLVRHVVDLDQIVCLTPRADMGSLAGVGHIAGRPVTSDPKRWRRGGAILVTTARSFKGLDAQLVVLFDLDDLDVPGFARSDLYVACSRARGHLVVVAHGAKLVDLMRGCPTE